MIRPSRCVPMMALAAVSLLPSSCGGDQAAGEGTAQSPLPAGRATPVLIVGADGLEWNVILPLLREGRLPNIARLMQTGSYGIYATDDPTESPRLWNTMATGKPPEEHGILGFVHKIPGQKKKGRVYTSQDRRAKAFWNILTDAGIENDTIGWWTTFPAEDVLGLMVSQTNTRQREGNLNKGSLLAGIEGQVHPAERQSEVLGILDDVESSLDERTLTIFGEFPLGLTDEEAKRWESCQWAFRADATYLEIARREALEGPAPVTAVYVGGTDVIGHYFWHAYHLEPFGLTEDSRPAQNFGHLVPRYYEYFDTELGELLALYPEDTTVLIVADHGHGTKLEVLEHGPAWYEKFPQAKFGDHRNAMPGVFIASGEGIATMAGDADLSQLVRDDLHEIAHIRDFLPTLLALVGQPVGEDLPGRVLTDVLAPAFLVAHPVRTIATHDDETWMVSRLETEEVDPPFSDERIEQLKSMGYLGGDDD